MNAPIIPLGNAIVDVSHQTLLYRNRCIEFTSLEFALFQILANRFRRPVSRDEISLHLYGGEWNGISRSVDVNIARLRRKLRQLTTAYLDIRSVRHVGYYLIDKEGVVITAVD